MRMSSSMRSFTRASRSCAQVLGERRLAASQVGAYGCDRQAQRLGDLGVGELDEVAEDETLPLARGQAAERLYEPALLVAQLDHFLRAGPSHQRQRTFEGGEAPSTQPRAGEVEDDRAEVGR